MSSAPSSCSKQDRLLRHFSILSLEHLQGLHNLYGQPTAGFYHSLLKIKNKSKNINQSSAVISQPWRGFRDLDCSGWRREALESINAAFPGL